MSEGQKTATQNTILLDLLSRLDVEYLLCGHPYGHPGVIEGKETIEKNFAFIKANILS